MKIMPNYLKVDIVASLIRKALIINLRFINNPDILDIIMYRVKLKLYDPEGTIIRYADFGMKMYFVAKGEVDIFAKDKNFQF